MYKHDRLFEKPFLKMRLRYSSDLGGTITLHCPSSQKKLMTVVDNKDLWTYGCSTLLVHLDVLMTRRQSLLVYLVKMSFKLSNKC